MICTVGFISYIPLFMIAGLDKILCLQWCQNSLCIFDGRAPQAPDMCIYGDYKGRLDNGLLCSDLAMRNPWLCYNSKYQEQCCHTCDSLFMPNREGTLICVILRGPRGFLGNSSLLSL